MDTPRDHHSTSTRASSELATGQPQDPSWNEKPNRTLVQNDSSSPAYKPMSSSSRNPVICTDGTSSQFSKNNSNVVELDSHLVKSAEQPTCYDSRLQTYVKDSAGWKSWISFSVSGLGQKLYHVINMTVAWSFVNTLLSTYKWLASRFHHSKNNIDKAPDCGRTNVNLDSLNYPAQLADLAALLVSRFNLSGAEEDINEALLYARLASEHTPEDSVDKCAQLAILVAALNSRFNAYNDPRDFEEATYVATEWAFWCVDHYADTDDEVYELASKSLAVLDSQDKPKYFSEIGLAFENRLEQSMSPSKRLRDLNLAVHFGQLAIENVPDTHAEKPRYADNLQRSITMRNTIQRGPRYSDERVNRRRYAIYGSVLQHLHE